MNVEREVEKRKRERGDTPLKNKKTNQIAIDDLILEAPEFGTNKIKRREVERMRQNEEMIDDNQPELVKGRKKETLKDRINRCPIINLLFTFHKEDITNFRYLNKLSDVEVNQLYTVIPQRSIRYVFIPTDRWKVINKIKIKYSNRSIRYDKDQKDKGTIINYLDISNRSRMRTEPEHYKKKILPMFSKLTKRLMLIITNGISENSKQILQIFENCIKTNVNNITIVIEEISRIEAIIHMTETTYNVLKLKLKDVIEVNTNEKGGQGNNSFLYDFPGNFIKMGVNKPNMCIGEVHKISKWIYNAVVKQSGVAFSSDIKLREILSIIPHVNLVTCRYKHMKCQKRKWRKRLVVIPATEEDRQELLKLSVNYAIEPILDVQTQIKIKEFTKIDFPDLCIKQLLFDEGCPHNNTGNPCIGKKLHLKDEIGKSICKFINDGNEYPVFYKDDTYNFIMSTIKKIERPAYLKVRNRLVQESFKDIILGIKPKPLNTLFTARDNERKIIMANINSQTEEEARLEILRELNAKVDILEGIKEIELNGEKINYQNNKQCAVILFKTRNDAILFQKFTSLIKSKKLTFDKFRFNANTAETVIKEKTKKETKLSLQLRIEKLENRIDNIITSSVKNKFNNVNCKLDLILKKFDTLQNE
jgi:hypothetical protein